MPGSQSDASAPANTSNSQDQQRRGSTLVDGVNNNNRQPQNGTQGTRDNDSEEPSASISAHWNLTDNHDVQRFHDTLAGSASGERRSNGSNATQVLTEDKRMKWFKYPRREAWDKEFDSLLEETKKIANDIKLAVEKGAGVTLRKRKPNEKRPQPTLERLDVGWVTVPAGYIVYLVSVAPEDCLEVAVQVRMNMKDDNYHSVVGWLCGSGVVLFERVSYRTEPAGIYYVSVPVPTSPLGEEE
ncbi:hypothetical protein DM02DRAFT_653885 [Periconia macrospinosa]|uniref:Uncharacterized protein n=1 Tax=Periconia macrospinosa TaxID=97972 RepID=A0A2V1DZ25_9PLEO|nr:hypothetical protein DM02DRAFT_653885 [Periconia macrospinosa]